jgi:hypothetical protein
MALKKLGKKRPLLVSSSSESPELAGNQSQLSRLATRDAAGAGNAGPQNEQGASLKAEGIKILSSRPGGR